MASSVDAYREVLKDIMATLSHEGRYDATGHVLAVKLALGALDDFKPRLTEEELARLTFNGRRPLVGGKS